MKTIEDYLPQAGLVRVQLNTNKTYLLPVSCLPSVAAKNPKKKIAVSYASFRGGQSYDHVREVTSVCIDLDVPKEEFVSREKVEALHRRFPRAALVVSHGVTLIYKLPRGLTWEASLTYAVPIGAEAEATFDLKYDVGTHLVLTCSEDG
jgi:hypothetical protein